MKKKMSGTRSSTSPSPDPLSRFMKNSSTTDDLAAERPKEKKGGAGGEDMY